MPVGIGYDIHALVKGPKLMLGGVEVPHTHGLKGHSDGDSLLHAIVDALLGAAGAGDIGEYFNDKDPRWKNAASLLFLKETAALLKKNKWKIVNVDAVLVCEEPKITPYKLLMRKKISQTLGISVELVNVKAKTNEGFGAIGKKKAIAAYAIAELRKIK